MDREDAKNILRPIIGAAVNQAQTLDAIWAIFEAAILDPIKASAMQRQETRRAFYAGAAATFEMMMRVSSDDVDEAAGEQLLTRLSKDLERFSSDVAEGRA